MMRLQLMEQQSRLPSAISGLEHSNACQHAAATACLYLAMRDQHFASLFAHLVLALLSHKVCHMFRKLLEIAGTCFLGSLWTMVYYS